MFEKNDLPLQKKSREIVGQNELTAFGELLVQKQLLLKLLITLIFTASVMMPVQRLNAQGTIPPKEQEITIEKREPVIPEEFLFVSLEPESLDDAMREIVQALYSVYSENPNNRIALASVPAQPEVPSELVTTIDNEQPVADLLNFLTDHIKNAPGAVTVFLNGHGSHINGEFQMLVKSDSRSNPTRMTATELSAAIASAIQERFEQHTDQEEFFFTLIIDSCYSGSALITDPVGPENRGIQHSLPEQILSLLPPEIASKVHLDVAAPVSPTYVASALISINFSGHIADRLQKGDSLQGALRTWNGPDDRQRTFFQRNDMPFIGTNDNFAPFPTDFSSTVDSVTEVISALSTADEETLSLFVRLANKTDQPMTYRASFVGSNGNELRLGNIDVASGERVSLRFSALQQDIRNIFAGSEVELQINHGLITEVFKVPDLSYQSISAQIHESAVHIEDNRITIPLQITNPNSKPSKVYLLATQQNDQYVTTTIEVPPGVSEHNFQIPQVRQDTGANQYEFILQVFDQNGPIVTSEQGKFLHVGTVDWNGNFQGAIDHGPVQEPFESELTNFRDQDCYLVPAGTFWRITNTNVGKSISVRSINEDDSFKASLATIDANGAAVITFPEDTVIAIAASHTNDANSPFSYTMAQVSPVQTATIFLPLVSR